MSTSSTFFVNHDAPLDFKHILKMILMSFSLLSICIVIAINFLIGEIRRQHFQKLKIYFSLCLLMSFFFIIFTNLYDFMNSPIFCLFIALVIQYFSLASFFWLTCMSLHCWLNLSRRENPLQNPGRRERRLRRRLNLFFVFAFGIPFIISSITLALQLSFQPDMAPYSHPG